MRLGETVGREVPLRAAGEHKTIMIIGAAPAGLGWRWRLHTAYAVGQLNSACIAGPNPSCIPHSISAAPGCLGLHDRSRVVGPECPTHTVSGSAVELPIDIRVAHDRLHVFAGLGEWN